MSCYNILSNTYNTYVYLGKWDMFSNVQTIYNTYVDLRKYNLCFLQKFIALKFHPKQ